MNDQSESKGCFTFLQALEPTAKPRRTRLSLINDRGLSLAATQSFIETCCDIVDHVKMPDHYAMVRRYTPSWLQEKNRLYRSAGIETTVGGVLFEIASVQNKVPQLIERVAELGFSGFEVSEDVIEPLPQKTRRDTIQQGIKAGLHVFTELGRKFPDKPFDADEAAEMAERDLEAGAFLIVIENSDIIDIIREGRDCLHRLAGRIPMEKLVFETGPNERVMVSKWLISEFGPDVNIENIEVEDAPAIAAMRAGLHRRVGFSYFAAEKVASPA